MASKLLEGPLCIEEPLSSRPGFKGRSTIQQIDSSFDGDLVEHESEYYYDADYPYRDSVDARLYDCASEVYDLIHGRNFQNLEEKYQAIVEEFNRRLLPPNVMRMYARLYIPPEEVHVFDVCMTDYHSMLTDEHFVAGRSINRRLHDKKLIISLSLSSSIYLDSVNPKLNREMTFLDVFIGSFDDTQHFLIGSFHLQYEEFQQFLADKIRMALNFVWPDGSWNELPILMILLSAEIDFDQETLALIHPDLSSVFILPCVPQICARMFPKLEPKFELLKQFTRNLQSFLQQEPMFFELFCLDFPRFFNMDLRNYFQLVDFYAKNYGKIREHVLMFCMPEELIYQQISTAFTPQHLCSLISYSSVWQSLVNVTLLLKNYWFFPHPNYSPVMVALELENIVRHGGEFPCEQLKQLNIDRLILLARLFKQKMPLVPATIKHQVPLYHKMFEDYLLRGYDLEEIDEIHNLTAVSFATKEIVFDYDLSIRDEPGRYYKLTRQDFWSPYEAFGNFELDHADYLALHSMDDSQIDLIRTYNRNVELQDMENIASLVTTFKSGSAARKRHHSSITF